LAKGKKYYVDGKPRNPFKSNTDVIKAIIERYSFTDYEADAAATAYKDLLKSPELQAGLEEKLKSREKLPFLESIFPLIFMGEQISKFFLRLLILSVSRDSKTKDGKQHAAEGMLSQIVEHVDLNVSYDGVDFIGKKFFMDLFVRDMMSLVYAYGASLKHRDLMKISHPRGHHHVPFRTGQIPAFPA